jgi:hypothetical protein
MTQQEIFNTVATHLILQNVKAVAGNSCKYRTTNGLKCAAGCLIPDSEYKVSFEGSRIVAIDFFIDLCGGKNTKTFGLLQDLQGAHDYIEPNEWKHELRVIANDYGLIIPDCLL